MADTKWFTGGGGGRGEGGRVGGVLHKHSLWSP